MKSTLISAEYETMIFTIRGRKIMVDYDLALLYSTNTKSLKQQVRRNITRFPNDFMFELTADEKTELVTKCDRLSNLKHSNSNPLAFTEQGVAMLSSVLKSSKAIQINIEIMRAFARYRSLLHETLEIRKELVVLDKKFTAAFDQLARRLNELHQKKNQPRTRIGFKKDEI